MKNLVFLNYEKYLIYFIYNTSLEHVETKHLHIMMMTMMNGKEKEEYNYLNIFFSFDK